MVSADGRCDGRRELFSGFVLPVLWKMRVAPVLSSGSGE